LNILKHIPNTITLGNLFCGCLAIVSAFKGNLDWTAYFVGIALILDFFDGFAARMLKVSSAIGKDLDSLADMVTFGVVPGVVMYHLIYNSFNADYSGAIIQYKLDPSSVSEIVPYFGFIITIFSCIRLAKFNNDTRQSDSFIGLPTPANAMVICSIPLIFHFQPHLQGVTAFLSHLPSLMMLTLIMSYLLVAEIPLFALKFKSFGWKENKLVYSFLLASIAILLSFKFIGISLVVFLYILISIVNNIFLKKKV
jgi:CDP-diacylglycerol--serine O-phosphatidyltransferase